MSQATLTMPRGVQMIGGRPVHWGGLPEREKVERKGLKMALMLGSFSVGAAGMLSSIVPFIGQHVTSPILLGASHLFDRAKNKVTATDELTYRAQLHTKDIRAELAVRGIKFKTGPYATVDELKEASKSNRALRKIYEAPLKEQNDENRSSMLLNGGIMAAGALFPGGGVVAGVGNAVSSASDAAKMVAEGAKVTTEVSKFAQMAKSGLAASKIMARDASGMLAGGALARVLSADEVDPVKLSEAMAAALKDAQERGMNVEDVLSPKLLFTLRVAQDSMLAKHIKETSGKAFHKMDDEQQLQVMAKEEFAALRQSVEADVAQLSSIQDPQARLEAVSRLSATEADLSPTRKYAVGTPAVGFVDRELARRTAANDARIPESNVRTISHADRIRAQRQQAAAMAQMGRKV